MEDDIRNFPKQFAYEPKIENLGKLQKFERHILVGMGGSHLQGGLLLIIDPTIDLTIHRDYGLPAWSEKRLRETLIIVSSYSGNTEETISAFEEAVEKNFPVAAIAKGGRLIERAKKQGVPYIQLPEAGVQPRSATGFTVKALSKMIGREDIVREMYLLSTQLKPEDFAQEGKALADILKGKIPLIYSSRKNGAIAYNWKVKFNEGPKIPAFYNVFPELNHNEMTGFDVVDSTKSLSEKFYFIFLKDAQDHPQIKKRMDILKKLFDSRGLPVQVLELREGPRLSKIFSSLLLGDWAAYHLARYYGVEPEKVPMVEEFKKLIK